MKEQPTLFEMPFNLAQDEQQDGARIQIEQDKARAEAEKNRKAQRVFVVGMPKYDWKEAE